MFRCRKKDIGIWKLPYNENVLLNKKLEHFLKTEEENLIIRVEEIDLIYKEFKEIE